MDERVAWKCALCGTGMVHDPSCYHSVAGIERERAEERAAGRSGNLYRASEPVTAVEAFEQGYRRGVLDGLTRGPA